MPLCKECCWECPCWQLHTTCYPGDNFGHYHVCDAAHEGICLWFCEALISENVISCSRSGFAPGLLLGWWLQGWSWSFWSTCWRNSTIESFKRKIQTIQCWCLLMGNALPCCVSSCSNFLFKFDISSSAFSFAICILISQFEAFSASRFQTSVIM